VVDLPSPLVGKGGDVEPSETSRVRGVIGKPLTRSSLSLRTTLSHKGRGKQEHRENHDA
jgi:hypothetical protein